MEVSHFTVDHGLLWAFTLVKHSQIFRYHLLTGFTDIITVYMEVFIVHYHGQNININTLTTTYTLNFFTGFCTFKVTASSC